MDDVGCSFIEKGDTLHVSLHVAPHYDNDLPIKTDFTASAVQKYFTNYISQDGYRKEIINDSRREVRLPGCLGQFYKQEFHHLGGEHPCSSRLEDCFVGSCVADSLDGAPLANSDIFASGYTSAVVFISGVLAHPGWR